MTALRDLLRDSKRLVSMAKSTGPEPVKLRAQIDQLVGEIGQVSETDIAKIQARFKAAYDAGMLASLTRRDLRQVCSVYLLDPHPPGRDRDLSGALLDLVHQQRQRMPLLILINSYLDSFRESDPDITRLGFWIDQAVREWPAREGDPWPALAQSLDLFDPLLAPRRLANATMTGRLSAQSVLSRCGLDSQFRFTGGLAEAAFNVACAGVATSGADLISKQQRLFSWATSSTGRLNYPSSWIAFARACLEPWKDVDPAQDHRTAIISLLFDFGAGDPRLGNNNRWAAVQDRAPEAFAILMRWLTRASVLQFLDIVDRSLVAPEAKEMWSYRRAFWTSYLLGSDGGPQIDEAWVAFGSDAAALANRIADQTGDRSFKAFGIQNERSTQHSALILKIRGMTIVDWSHSSKCQFWPRGHAKALPLYQNRYHIQLYTAPSQEVHFHPQSYGWQKKFASMIEGKRFYSAKPSWKP